MKQTPRERAYNLYFHTNLTQAQIAERAGVSTRALYDWMKQGNWKNLKATSRLMPAQIVDDIYKHISHLNWKIKNRDFEDRYPTKEEAETLRKLIFTIPKIKLNVSKGESAQAMINFVSWLQTRNNDAAIYISDFIDEYLHAPRQKGMEPYEFEYDADQYYNPEDFPWRTQQTFEERAQEIPLSRGDSSETTDVVSEQGCVQPRNEQPPNQTTETTSSTSLRDTKQSHDNMEKEAQPEAQEEKAPSLFLGKVSEGRKGNLAQDKAEPISESQSSESEANRNQTGSKSEVPPTSNKTYKPANNQPPNLKKLPHPTSENKNQENGSDQPDPSSPDYIQKVFELWQKEIKKNKQRRR